MYTKEQASQLRSEFWTRFGQYMRPVPGADGEKKNWLNYKTGVRDIFFRLDADKTEARISIELHHADADVRQDYFARFQALKPILEAITKEEWDWQAQSQDEHRKEMGSITHSLHGVNIFNANDWPAIISFFKPRIIALDDFWNLVRENFE